MSVSITFSRSSGWGATAIADSLAGGSTGLDLGSVTNGSSTTEEDIYIYHDGTNEITDVSFYLNAYSGTYGGGADAGSDLSEIIGWGDSGADQGFRLDNDHDGVYEYYAKTGVMDSSANAVSLDDSSAGGTNSDDIGANPHYAHIKTKVTVPSSEDTAGIRQFDFVCKYTYTS